MDRSLHFSASGVRVVVVCHEEAVFTDTTCPTRPNALSLFGSF